MYQRDVNILAWLSRGKEAGQSFRMSDIRSISDVISDKAFALCSITSSGLFVISLISSSRSIVMALSMEKAKESVFRAPHRCDCIHINWGALSSGGRLPMVGRKYRRVVT